MKNDTILIVAMLGGAALLLVKSGKLKMPAQVRPSGPGASAVWNPWTPLNPDQGTPYTPTDPGQFIPVNDLINGTIQDYYQGDQSSYRTPLTRPIIADVLRDTYGTDVPSVVRVPGVWW